MTEKFTIPGYRAKLKEQQASAAAAEAFRAMEAPPVATELAATGGADATGGINQWYLLATGSLGLALVAAGSAMERARGQRQGAFDEAL